MASDSVIGMAKMITFMAYRKEPIFGPSSEQRLDVGFAISVAEPTSFAMTEIVPVGYYLVGIGGRIGTPWPVGGTTSISTGCTIIRGHHGDGLSQ